MYYHPNLVFINSMSPLDHKIRASIRKRVLSSSKAFLSLKQDLLSIAKFTVEEDRKSCKDLITRKTRFKSGP